MTDEEIALVTDEEDAVTDEEIALVTDEEDTVTDEENTEEDKALLDDDAPVLERTSLDEASPLEVATLLLTTEDSSSWELEESSQPIIREQATRAVSQIGK